MKHLVFIFLLANIFLHSTSGQTEPELSGVLTGEERLCGEVVSTGSLPNAETFFNIGWTDADIGMADGTVLRNRKVKYNGLLDELFYLDQGSNKIIIIDKESVIRFHFIDLMGDSSVSFKKLKVKREYPAGISELFVQELFRGKIVLYVFHNFYFSKNVTVEKDGRYFLKDVYVENPVYFIRFPGDSLVEVSKFSRRRCYELMPGARAQIRQYILSTNENRIKTNGEILDFARFLDGLTSL